jgi:hypothetical protein
MMGPQGLGDMFAAGCAGADSERRLLHHPSLRWSPMSAHRLLWNRLGVSTRACALEARTRRNAHCVAHAQCGRPSLIMYAYEPCWKGGWRPSLHP